MAISGSLGKLAVELGGDTAGLDAAHESSKQTLRSMAANIQRATAACVEAFSAMSSNIAVQSAAAGVAIQRFSTSSVAALQAIASAASMIRAVLIPVLAAAGIFMALNALDQAVKNTIDTFDKAASSAREFGVTVEQLSRLSFAARVAGVSTEQFNGALNTLIENSQKTDDVFASSTRALAAMGFQIKDLASDPAAAERTLMQFANRFQSMEDGANKTALAVAIFGDAGRAMLPLLNRGAAGILELTEQSKRFGAVISTEAAQAATEYTNNMRKFGELQSAVTKNITQELIPSFNSASRSFLDWAERINLVTKAGTAMRVVLASLDMAVQSVLTPFRALAAILGGVLGASLDAMNGQFAAARDRLAKIGADLGDVAGGFGKSIVDNIIYVDPSLKALATQLDLVRGKFDWTATVTKNKAPVMESAEAIRKAMADAAEANRVMFVELQRDVAMPLNDKLILLKMMLDADAISFRQYSAAVAQAEEQTRNLNATFNAMQVRDLVDSKELPMTEKVRRLNDMVRAGEITWRDYLGTMREVKDQGQRGMDDLASATSNALTAIFSESKTAAIASALINTYQAVSKAFATYGPTPQGFAMAGIAAAVGMAQVMKIRSTSKSSSGGSGGVSGGSSSAAAASSAPAAAPRESTLFVQGISAKQMFSGEVVRDLAQRLLDFQRDGGRVILAGAA